jgi:small acid-soluble spore protein P (minor)
MERSVVPLSKPKTVPVGPGEPNDVRDEPGVKPTEPLSGSKAVKNRQHSRQNHGEGS